MFARRAGGENGSPRQSADWRAMTGERRISPVGRELAPAGPGDPVPLTVRRADVGIGPYGRGAVGAGDHKGRPYREKVR